MIMVDFFDLWLYVSLNSKQLQTLQQIGVSEKDVLYRWDVHLSKARTVKFRIHALRGASQPQLMFIELRYPSRWSIRGNFQIFRSRDSRNSTKQSFERDFIGDDPQFGADDIVLKVKDIKKMDGIAFFCYVDIHSITNLDGQMQWKYDNKNGFIDAQSEDSDESKDESLCRQRARKSIGCEGDGEESEDGCFCQRKAMGCETGNESEEDAHESVNSLFD